MAMKRRKDIIKKRRASLTLALVNGYNDFVL
jgi:hypothetical protein